MSVGCSLKMAAVAGLFLFAPVGCAAPPPSPTHAAPPSANGTMMNSADLLAVLASPAAPDTSRVAANTALAHLGGHANADRLTVLEQLLYAPGQDDAMRNFAMDQLAAADPTRAGAALALYLPRMPPGPVLDHACGVAAKLGDPRLIDPLIRSWDRPAASPGTTSHHHPEPSAITAITGGPLDAALKNALLHSEDQSARVAALDRLEALQGQAAVQSWILHDHHDSDDPLMIDLRWWIGLFAAAPRGPAEVAWVRQLHEPQYAALLRRATLRHDVLKINPDYRFAPRFINLLSDSDAAGIAMTRARLLVEIAHQRHGRGDAGAHPLPLSHAAELSRCDLLTLRVLLRGLADPTLRRRLYQAGLDDLSDPSTAHGGLLKESPRRRPGTNSAPATSPATSATSTPPPFIAAPFEPMLTGDDGAYAPSDALLAATADALAQYRFHFQRVANSADCGPDAAERAYARRNRCDIVIFTSVAADVFDATYCTPSGVAVDLGFWKN